jgi:hypothetical protein
MDSAPFPGAVGPSGSVRPTAVPRPFVRPRLWDTGLGGLAMDHPYIRRFWTAAIGAGAVADLLRLATAARRDRSLRRPHSLPALIRAGLVRIVDGRIEVCGRVPLLPTHLVRRLPPRVRRDHERFVDDERRGSPA